MDMEQITAFFKWMTLINIGIFLISAVSAMALKKVMGRLHAKWFGIDEVRIAELQYAWLGNYKIFIVVFNIVPFFALSLMR